MSNCLKLHNKRREPRVMGTGEHDWRVRPSTPLPSKHWTYRLRAALGDSDLLEIRGAADGPELWVDCRYAQEDPDGFDQLMRFARSESVSFTAATDCNGCNARCVVRD